MNTQHPFGTKPNGSQPSPHQLRTGSVPLVNYQNPYARFSSGPIVMMDPIGAVTAMSVNPSLVGMGRMGMNNSTLTPSAPPLTNFVRNITPEYLMATATNGIHSTTPFVGFPQASAHKNNMRDMVNLNQIHQLYSSATPFLLNSATEADLALLSAQKAHMNNLCRDSLLMDEMEEDDDYTSSSSGSEDVSSNNSVVSGMTNEFSPKRKEAKQPMSIPAMIPFFRNDKKAELEKRKSYKLPSRKRKFESSQERTDLSRTSIRALRYKSKGSGAGAASWNAAVRKDISKVQDSSPEGRNGKCARKIYEDCHSSSSSNDDESTVEDDPIHTKALLHERGGYFLSNDDNYTVAGIITEESKAVPTCLARAVTDEIDANVNNSVTDHSVPTPTTLSRTELARAVTDESKEITKSQEERYDDLMICQPVSSAPRKPLLLATKEDKHWLSDLVCLIRENIEVFAATPEDVVARSRRGGIKNPIACGRVGLRCIHCASVPHDQKAKGAVSYPNSIRIVHQSVRNWQRYHFDACTKIPAHIRQAYSALKSTRSHSGNASLKYWIESTAKLGLVDTNAEDGIRFREGKNPLTSKTQDRVHIVQDSDSDSSKGSYIPSTVEEINRTLDDLKHDQPSLVTPSDKSEITDFLYELLNQQQACRYKAVDRNGKRKFRELGFPGVECRHCAKNAGAGRYFPLMITTLANNNNPFNCTHSHMMKCRRCPQEVKNKLAQLQLMHGEQAVQLSSGWKKAFFDKLWTRLHGSPNAPNNQNEKSFNSNKSVIVKASPGASVSTNDEDSAAFALSSFSAQAFSEMATEP